MKRIIFFMMLFLGALQINAQSPRNIYIHKCDNSIDTILVSDVNNVKHSKLDINGVEQSDFSTMRITDTDGTEHVYDISKIERVELPNLKVITFHGSDNTNSKTNAPKRTAIDGTFPGTKNDIVHFKWITGDKLFISNNESATATNITSNGYNADFKITTTNADTYTVFYPGQNSNTYNKVTIASSQVQRKNDNSNHIGTDGDCGTAIATMNSDNTAEFVLNHKASYLCFLPHLTKNNKGDATLTKITVTASKPIAGNYKLTNASGLTNASDTSNTISLSTSSFTIPVKSDQSTCAAYMVIAPQTTPIWLHITYTYYPDANSDVESSYTQTIYPIQPEKNNIYTICCDLSHTNTIGSHEYVDLGLPSGLKWANMNVGATTPEGYGNYYSWGETTTKTHYHQQYYKWYQNGKYVNPGGLTDISGSEYDAARANWGDTWRMPTKDEMQELFDKCTWTWTKLNGINGYNVTGPNGNSIFLPAGGYNSGTSVITPGFSGRYMTSTVWPSTIGNYEDEYNLYFQDLYSNSQITSTSRYYGISIRPISD